MIQAGLLIATYELAQGLVEAAYISIGTCARMGYASGIHVGHGRRSQSGSQIAPTLEDEEKRNLWWGIVMCERWELISKSSSCYAIIDV